MTKEKQLRKQDFPYIEFTVRAYDTSPHHRDDGRGLVTFVSFCTDVGEDGDKMGFLGGGIGSVVISVRDGSHYFQIPHDELWHAVMKGLEGGFHEPEPTEPDAG